MSRLLIAVPPWIVLTVTKITCVQCRSLSRNQLTALPSTVFQGLNSLYWLWVIKVQQGLPYAIVNAHMNCVADILKAISSALFLWTCSRTSRPFSQCKSPSLGAIVILSLTDTLLPFPRSLMYNQLSTVPEETLRPYIGRMVMLGSNPWHCCPNDFFCSSAEYATVPACIAQVLSVTYYWSLKPTVRFSHDYHMKFLATFQYVYANIMCAGWDVSVVWLYLYCLLRHPYPQRFLQRLSVHRQAWVEL